LKRSRITALLGPRQCGKTTLAREIAAGQPSTFFDLESPADRRRLENPETVLGELKGLVVLDEVQALPAVFPVLRVLADRPDLPARFLILGSASPHLVRATSETLAGRVEFIDLTGFGLGEVGLANLERLWLRGGFPLSFLADDEPDSLSWREGFVRTYLERDIPQLGFPVPSTTMRRLWTMLAHYHGQTWNGSELARSLGLSDKTVRGYLDVLTGTFMVRQLQPWFENLGKRQVKAPKVYLRDSGILHLLLDIPGRHELLGHPKVGASWEGFALEEVLRVFEPAQPCFWSVHGGAEVDLVFQHQGRRLGFEMKFSEAPGLTPSMRRARQDLKLDHLWVIHPGPHAYPMEEGISALPLSLVPTLGT
jgi:predicted AAA+ superfamily ATPase